MALQDTVTKQYMSKGEIFADAFNYLIYSGRQVIRPDQLSEMDTTQIAIPFAPQEQGKPETTQKYRDVLKTLSDLYLSRSGHREPVAGALRHAHPQHALRRAAI